MKFINSLDFPDAKHIKNNLSRNNNTKKSAKNSNSNYLLNQKENEAENVIKIMIENELANSLVKRSYACPMSSKMNKLNLLNKYVRILNFNFI